MEHFLGSSETWLYHVDFAHGDCKPYMVGIADDRTMQSSRGPTDSQFTGKSGVEEKEISDRSGLCRRTYSPI